MSKRRFSPIGLLACLAFHATLPSAHACICTEPPSVDQALADAEIVFLGTVSAQEDEDPFASPGEFRRINLQVETSWKGVTGTVAGVETPGGGAACGISSEVGQTLVVYGTRLESSGRIVVTLCSRTGLLGGALQDTDTLDDLGIVPIELSDGPDGTFAPFELEAGDSADGDPGSDDDADGGSNGDASSNAGGARGRPLGACGTAAPIVPLMSFAVLRFRFFDCRRRHRI